MMNQATLRHTRSEWSPTIARAVAALPLLGIGFLHASGAAPLLPILHGTPIPFPELNAVVGTGMELLAGVLLALGVFARLGGVIAAGSMAVALVAHATFAPYTPVGASQPFTWPDEPSLLLPLVVLAAASWVVLRGAGRFSLDAGATSA